MWPHQPMVINCRKIASPSTETIYIGQHHLPHDEKQTLPVKVQNVCNSCKLSRYFFATVCKVIASFFSFCHNLSK